MGIVLRRYAGGCRRHDPILHGEAKNFESDHKDDEPSRVELLPDFISYDSTSDIKWNTKYGELVKVRTKSCVYVFFLIFLSSLHAF